jgi:hypothetical protein
MNDLNSTLLEGAVAQYADYGFDIASTHKNETTLFKVFLADEKAAAYEEKIIIGCRVRITGKIVMRDGKTGVSVEHIEFKPSRVMG